MTSTHRLAQQLHREGKLSDARTEYRAIVEQDPADADAWHRLALVMHQLGELPEARHAAEAAFDLRPQSPHFAYLAGFIASDQGRMEAAIRFFEAAIINRPSWVSAYRSLAEAQMVLGKPALAADTLSRAVRLRPDDAGLHGSLAAAKWSAQDPEGAATAAAESLRIQPSQPMARLIMGKAALCQGDERTAMEHIQQCLRGALSFAEAWLLWAKMLRQQRSPSLRETLEASLHAAPLSTDLHIAWADFLWESGDEVAAMNAFRRAEELDASNVRAAVGSRLVLPQVYAHPKSVEEHRQRFASGLSQLATDQARFFMSKGGGLADVGWTNFFLAYQGRDDLLLQSRYGDFLSSVLSARVPALCEPRPVQSPRKRVRVGFLSHFFFNCTAGRYFASWILDLDPARFEVCVYYTNAWISPDTEKIRAAASRFYHLADVPLQAVARTVLTDSLDILIYPELGMHADTFGLACLRLAPLQLAGWGHPTTSGLPSIDGYVSCAEMEPDAATTHYRERLYLLPGLGTRYAKPPIDCIKDRADFGLPDGAALYLCPQSLFKIHPDNDALFARVLAANPSGRLVYFEGRNNEVTSAFRVRLELALREMGVEPAESLIQLPYMPHSDYLQVNALCDVMLDTLHWSGGNTALDAISAGLPVVTLPGTLMRGRQSLAMLRRLQVEELIANDEADYVERALVVAQNKDLRSILSSRIRANHGELFGDPAPTKALAALLERLVRESE